jgi:hypothetical protein
MCEGVMPAMRDFTKSMARFSWAMSLFGVRQTLDALNPRSRSQDQTGATGGFDTVSNAVIDQFGETLRKTFDAGDRIQREIIDAVFGMAAPGFAPGTGNSTPRTVDVLPVFAAKSQAGEEVILSYTRGQGQFSDDRRFISLNNQIYLLDGRRCGIHQGVWERLFESPQDL